MHKTTENVWDYPRPAVCEPFYKDVLVIVENKIIAKTTSAIRVLETSHPPTYYFPIKDVKINYLKKNKNNSFCEWKGIASYFDLDFKKKTISDIGWVYLNPNKNFISIKNYISFYASKADKCIVDGEQVLKQEGDFYGGWITSNLKGPFKGGPKTMEW